MRDGSPLIVGRPNYSNKMTSFDVGEGFVVTNYQDRGFGLIGVGRGVGVYGAAADQGIGVYGRVNGADAYAGYFVGDVAVLGNSTVFVGHTRIAVRHPDQSDRLLYSIGSPECWFQDFGRAKLIRGRTEVKLDGDFAALVRTADYHVFLTPEGKSNGLYVTGKNKTGFEVREQLSGKSSVKFSYQIVARRKGVRVARLQKVKFPKMPNFPNRRSERNHAAGSLPWQGA
jgi:hypothetical protein